MHPITACTEEGPCMSIAWQKRTKDSCNVHINWKWEKTAIRLPTAHNSYTN